jgi:hypothetical protein
LDIEENKTNRRLNMKKILTSLVILILTSTVVTADVIYADGADRSYDTTGGQLGSAGADSNPIGVRGTGVGLGAVIPFLIPTLDGASITSAELSITLLSNTLVDSNPSMYLEVYGARSATTAGPVPADFTGVTTPLVSNWLQFNSNTATGTYTASSSALTSWISGQAGTTGDVYVFLTLRSNIVPSGSYDYVYMASGNATADQPTLTITTSVPEPATIGMLGFGSLVALLLRRFKI